MTKRNKTLWLIFIVFVGVLMSGAGVLLASNLAPITNQPSPSPLHPPVVLLDVDGTPVIESGAPVSTMLTCGTCHDTNFIATHSFHTDAGLSGLHAPDNPDAMSAWDISNGYFGRWNPITYRYLSTQDDEHPDLTTADWVRFMGYRHVGGAPAVIGRDGELLTQRPPDADDIEASTISDDGERLAWDWATSGTVEMNCFLCHTANPDNSARISALESGQFQWANTATLASMNLVTRADNGYTWNAEAFHEDGSISMATLPLQSPTSANCASCHGMVHTDNRTPLTLDDASQTAWTTLTTGQILSPQRIANSALNISGKATLSRAWDVHAERALNCTSCHYSLNNPVYYQRTPEGQVEHLTFDPRRLSFGEYMYRPSHDFARGQSATRSSVGALDNTMRRCESCHSIDATHDWLPYKERHTEVLACESCHIPQLYAPALESIDWTVLQTDGEPISVYRGIEGGIGDPQTTLVSGYTPILLPHDNADGTTSLMPFNLVTAWYWVHGEPERPVPQRDLIAVWFDDGEYPADILALFDADGDGTLSRDELLIDTPEKEALIRERLVAQGLDNPRIVGETRPYGVHHNVTTGAWAVRQCTDCHAEDSRMSATFTLASRSPMDVLPLMNSDALGAISPQINDAGVITITPNPADLNYYVFGNTVVVWIDILGMLIFLGTLGGVSLHALGRYLASRRRVVTHPPKLQRVYMYTVYERQWHWLQTALIFGLIFTGIVIHRPDYFSIFDMRWMVYAHNILALILVINAALAAFYHFASGEIRQFLPTPYGFFNDAFAQAKFYISGIFKGEPHPFEKTPEKKMNPLQQMTYLMILNVLLPAQVITGILMWGLQQFPDVAGLVGGLPFLAPLHTLIAWLFATFIVAHVYLTTTAHEPLAGIRAMMMGWDEIEVHEAHEPTQGTSES